ncbi:MAG: hypothetical protein RMY35_001160 [Nostoc sp. DedSLP01]|nr:hypothetical protein [Nostoc sp. DedSLP05]
MRLFQGDVVIYLFNDILPNRQQHRQCDRIAETLNNLQFSLTVMETI